MAKLERTLSGDFNQLIKKIETGILNGSMSASLEDFSDFYSGEARQYCLRSIHGERKPF